jgi:hypothetical protein
MGFILTPKPDPPISFFASPACYVDPTVRLVFDLRVMRVLCAPSGHIIVIMIYSQVHRGGSRAWIARRLPAVP